MDRLYKELLKHSKEGPYPFHMPGHKRNECLSFLKDAYSIDITEIDNFDNLHDADGIIKKAQENAARIYHSEESHFLVNGSSAGILASIFSVCNKGDKIILARNCHKSVYNAVKLNELETVYIYPQIIGNERINGCIYPNSVEETILSNPDAKAVVITSPTYDGVISDIAGIAKKCHEFDIPLIVDEAHGALFFMEGRSAVICGADIVINSVHKTLPALTQTALLHVNGKIFDREKLREYLSVFQTSSPSYVLMASIDYAMEIIESEGAKLYRDYCIRTYKLKEELKKLRHLKLILKDSLITSGIYDYDEGKILISTDGTKINGKQLSNLLLEKYNIQCEMSAAKYCLLMSTIMDSMDGIDLLIKALIEIDDSVMDYEKKENRSDTESEIEILKNNIGKKSEKTVYVYPPGIPILVEGEIIIQEAVIEIERALNAGLDVKGL